MNARARIMIVEKLNRERLELSVQNGTAALTERGAAVLENGDCP
jgi:hypothetical protein